MLLLAAGAAWPIYLLSYQKLSHTCTDPFRIMFVTDTESSMFHFDLYSTIVTVFTYVLPILILPLALPIAALRTCLGRQCCVTRFKQPIGELIMTSIVCLIYLGTIVGVVLPRIDQMMELESVSVNKQLNSKQTADSLFFRLSLVPLLCFGRLAIMPPDLLCIS